MNGLPIPIENLSPDNIEMLINTLITMYWGIILITGPVAFFCKILAWGHNALDQSDHVQTFCHFAQWVITVGILLTDSRARLLRFFSILPKECELMKF